MYNDITVAYYLSNVIYGNKDPNIYNSINILYDQNGYVSPLQRWNKILIDLDKINYITDATIVPIMGCLWITHNIHINIDMSLGALYNFKLTCNTFRKDIEITEDEFKSISHHNSRIYENIFKKSYYQEYEEPKEDQKLVQQYMVDDLIKVWKMYKEK